VRSTNILVFEQCAEVTHILQAQLSTQPYFPEMSMLILKTKLWILAPLACRKHLNYRSFVEAKKSQLDSNFPQFICTRSRSCLACPPTLFPPPWDTKRGEGASISRFGGSTSPLPDPCPLMGKNISPKEEYTWLAIYFHIFPHNLNYFIFLTNTVPKPLKNPRLLIAQDFRS